MTSLIRLGLQKSANFVKIHQNNKKSGKRISNDMWHDMINEIKHHTMATMPRVRNVSSRKCFNGVVKYPCIVYAKMRRYSQSSNSCTLILWNFCNFEISQREIVTHAMKEKDFVLRAAQLAVEPSGGGKNSLGLRGMRVAALIAYRSRVNLTSRLYMLRGAHQS